MAKRNQIIMMKRVTPKRVTLPNGRMFVIRYQRITHAHLPANILLNWPYKQRAATKGKQWIQWVAQQQGCGVRSFVSKLYTLAKKVAKVPIVREVGKMALNELLNLYTKGTSKIKNKKIKIFLQSDLANLLMDMCTQYGRQKLG